MTLEYAQQNLKLVANELPNVSASLRDGELAEVVDKLDTIISICLSVRKAALLEKIEY